MVTIGMTRRSLLARVLTAAGVSLVGTAPVAWAQDRAGAAGFMDHALAMQRRAVETGDQPYGAVVAKDRRVVGEGPSRVVVNRDPTAHAEIEAIRDAAKRLGTRDLAGCVIYATSKPCGMCEAASYWARLSRIYFGEAVTDGGPPRYPSC
jgi:tRNA(Arg) A34 adenosine deaminase TadA